MKKITIFFSEIIKNPRIEIVSLLSFLTIFLFFAAAPIGNLVAHSLGLTEKRRILQLFFLIVPMVFLGRKVKVTYILSSRSKNILMGISLLFFTYHFFRAESSAVVLKLFFCFFYFCLIALSIKKDLPLSIEKDEQKDMFFFKLLVAVGYFFLFSAYFIGPHPGEVYTSFGGNNIRVGLLGIVGIIMTWGFPFWRKILVSFPFWYLLILSTSRTSLMGMIVALPILFIVNLFQKKIIKVFIPSFVIGCVLSVFLFFATLSGQNNFPYFSQTNKEAKFNSREFMNRSTRFIKVAYIVLESVSDKESNQFFQDLTKKYLNFINGLSSNNSTFKLKIEKKYVNHLANYTAKTEHRSGMIQETVDYLIKNPFGTPGEFKETVKSSCGKNVLCLYPHNIFLEFAYYAGVFPAILYLLLVVYLAFQLIMTLIKDDSFYSYFCCASMFCLLLSHNLTGTFYDNIFLPITAIIIFRRDFFLSGSL